MTHPADTDVGTRADAPKSVQDALAQFPGKVLLIRRPDRRDAVTLREALRALLRENNGGDPDPGAVVMFRHMIEVCPDVVDRGARDPGGVSSRLSDRRLRVRGGRRRQPC